MNAHRNEMLLRPAAKHVRFSSEAGSGSAWCGDADAGLTLQRMQSPSQGRRGKAGLLAAGLGLGRKSDSMGRAGTQHVSVPLLGPLPPPPLS